MFSTPQSLAIIIPVGPGDHSWTRVIDDLKTLPEQVEVCVVSTEDAPTEFTDRVKKSHSSLQVKWVVSPHGRAKQQNVGVEKTSADQILFLHSDSHLTPTSIDAVIRWISTKHEKDLGYLDLKFLNDGPMWMPANAKGVWFRSHVLKIPFGDQGFCLSRSFFLSLGQFNETIDYGEDHLLVWQVRKAGGRIVWMGDEIETSARKYANQGWLKTTLLHLVLTAKQAIPEVCDLIKQKVRARS